jgi:hypothetical protein
MISNLDFNFADNPMPASPWRQSQISPGAPVRGIVIAHDFTARAIAASKAVPSIELRKYKFNFSFQKV